MESQAQRFRFVISAFVDTIDSSSYTGYHIFAITIPRDACSDCIDEGHKLYKNTSAKYTNVYLQDRTNDEFLAK